MMNEDAARRAAEAALSELFPRSSSADEEVVVWKVDEHTRAWIVHFATRRWIETQDFRDQLVGSCPFVVDKATGHLHLYGSGPDEYARFVEWLDAPLTS